MSCASCPQVVINTIAAEVQKTLTKVRRIKYLTTAFNRFFAEIEDKIEDDLQALVNLIPAPPVLDISDIVGFLTCPLTPLAVEIDATLLNTLDPRRLALRVKKILQAEGDAVIKLYEEACAGGSDFSNQEDAGAAVAGDTQVGTAQKAISRNNFKITMVCPQGTFVFHDDGAGSLVMTVAPTSYAVSVATVNYDTGDWVVVLNLPVEAGGNITLTYEQTIARVRNTYLIRTARKYIQEIYRVMQDAFEFILEYPINFARAAYIQSTCPDIYNNASYPFQALTRELTNWSFDGFLPTGIDERARSILRILAEGEQKLLAWRTVGTIIV